jgi:hypothetical protein
MVATASLQALASRAERSGKVYPYRDEDWLRYLVPSLWPADGKPLLLLAGPSTVREDLLVEDFAAAFPAYRAYQGGLSLGTLNDALAALQYVERVYGSRALPSILVLGVSPRFLAEIPDDRPFALGLDRYSRHYRVGAQAPGGITLVAKSPLHGMLDEAQFLARKQQPRYRASLAWLTAGSVSPERSARLSASPAARLLERTGVARFLSMERMLRMGVHDYAAEAFSPYRYRQMEPWPVADLTAWLDDSTSWWRDVYRWDPAGDAAVYARIGAFMDFVARHGIDLYVVNLPDRGLSRARYAPGVTERYTTLVHTAFGGAPVLDLRCALPDDQFLDAEHALVPGARLVTRRVIGFVAQARRERAHERGGLTWPVSRTAAGWVGGCCPGAC